MSLTRTILSVVAILVLALASASTALADAKHECTFAYENTQVLRDASKVEEAIEAATICSRDVCTKFIRDDCARWKADLEAQRATVVVEVVDARGKPVTEGSVSLDGAPWLDRLGGPAQVVSSGPHSLVITVKGRPPRTESIVIRQGEKDRKITITLPPATRRTKPAQRLGPWVLGGIGVALLVGGAVTGGIVVHDYDVAKDQCNDATRTCTREGRDAASRGQVLGPMTTTLLVGGGALVAGGVIWLIAAPSAEKPPTTSLFVAPSISGRDNGLVLQGSW